MQRCRAGWSPRTRLQLSQGIASSLELGPGFDPAGTHRLNAKHALNPAMQPRLRHAPPPEHGTGIRARGSTWRQPEGEWGSGLCLGQAMGPGERVLTSAWPTAITSKWPCINSRSPHYTDAPRHPLLPHPDPNGFAQPHLSHGCRPAPSLPTGPRSASSQKTQRRTNATGRERRKRRG